MPLRHYSEYRIAFGYVIGLADEFGQFSIDELEDICGPLGLPIERDEYFEPKSLADIQHYREMEWRYNQELRVSTLALAFYALWYVESISCHSANSSRAPMRSIAPDCSKWLTDSFSSVMASWGSFLRQ